MSWFRRCAVQCQARLCSRKRSIRQSNSFAWLGESTWAGSNAPSARANSDASLINALAEGTPPIVEIRARRSIMDSNSAREARQLCRIRSYSGACGRFDGAGSTVGKFSMRAILCPFTTGSTRDMLQRFCEAAPQPEQCSYAALILETNLSSSARRNSDCFASSEDAPFISAAAAPTSPAACVTLTMFFETSCVPAAAC